MKRPLKNWTRDFLLLNKMDIIPEGTVIEFLESQRFITAAVTGRKGSRVRVLTHTGRELNLAPGRIIAASRKKIPG